MMPSQNDGVAMPPMANVRTTTSIQVFCFSAEIVPSGIAIRMAITVASSAISSEIGSRVRISSETGLPDHIEMPKSKWKKPQTKSRNWMISGRSRPSSRVARSSTRVRIEAAAAGAQAHHADVARDQAHQNEHQRRRPDQRRDHQQHALGNVLVHCRCPPHCAAIRPRPRADSGTYRSAPVQPDVGQVLIDVVARADLPALAHRTGPG